MKYKIGDRVKLTERATWANRPSFYTDEIYKEAYIKEVQEYHSYEHPGYKLIFQKNIYKNSNLTITSGFVCELDLELVKPSISTLWDI